MLRHCDEHVNAKDETDGKKDEGKKDDTFQVFAVIAIALVSVGEGIGAEMSLRRFNPWCMHNGDPIIRKAVPLAIGLVSASNPQLPILDTLSKYCRDNDLQVAVNANFAMGLVGVGMNNTHTGIGAYGQRNNWGEPFPLRPRYHEPVCYRWFTGYFDGLHGCEIIRAR